MVSNSVGMTAGELAEDLARIGREYASDPRFQEIRQELPEAWPF